MVLGNVHAGGEVDGALTGNFFGMYNLLLVSSAGISDNVN